MVVHGIIFLTERKDIAMMRTKKSKDASSPHPRKRVLRIEIAPATLIIGVLVLCVAWLLIRLLPVLLALVAALMIVGTLNPAVEWLESRHIRRGYGIAIIFSLFLLIIVLPLILTIPALVDQVASLVAQEPELRARAAGFLSRYPLTASLADYLRDFHYDALIKSFGVQMLAFSTRIIETVAYSAGAVFLALYIMIDRDRLRGALFAVVPRSHHIQLSRIMTNLQTIVGGYLRGQIVTCLMMGIFLYILLQACGVPNALAFAVFGGIADVLPFIGVFLTMIPAVLAALVKGPVITLVVFAALLVYEELESRFLIPLVYGRALRLPSSVVLFSLIAGGSLYGIAGALLALPMAATILMLIDELRVELPGEQAGNSDLKEVDKRNEAEYERRTAGMAAEEAAAVAVEITDHRKKEETASGPHAKRGGPPERPHP
jgi:predicted PurR-regulated permease PerM